MELFQLFGRIAIDNTEAERAIDSTTNRAKDAESKQTNAFSAIGSSAKTMAVGIGTACVAIGGAFIGAVEGTREYRTEMGKLDTAFVASGHASDSAKKTYSELHAVLGDSGQAVEASQHLAKLTDNEKDLQTWTDICTGVYATFGASLPIESLTESSNEVAKSGVLTGGLVDALVWAGISEEEFQAKLDECTSEQERQNLIMDTLNGTYKEASDQYKLTNKDVMDAQKANEKLTDAFAELGKVGEPIMTTIKNAIAKMVETAVPKIADLIEKFKDCKKWIKENEDTIKTWGAVIAGVVVTIGTFMLAMAWSSIMSKAKLAIEGVAIAVKAFNLALKSNPIGLVISIIAGLVTAIIILWNTNEDFRKFWISAWEKIKEVCSKAWEGIKQAWNKAGDWFSGIWKTIKTTANDLWTSVKKFFSDAWASIKNVWNACGSFFSGIWSSIKNTFGSVASWFTGIFRNAWNGIKSAFSGFASFFSGLWNAIKNTFSNLGTSIASAIGGAVKSGINGVITMIQNTINGAIKLINGAIKLINKIPKVNISKIKELKFPKLAEGGVLKKGQVGFLEGSGAEVVVPLEKNTGWIDKVAERIQPSANNEEMISKMNVIIEMMNRLLGIDLNIVLDSGVLVGELAPSMDIELGKRTIKKTRMNI